MPAAKTKNGAETGSCGLVLHVSLRVVEMKFKKMLTINIAESKLDLEYWRKVDEFTEARVNLPKDSSEIEAHLADADCLLAGFGVKVDKEILDKSKKLKYIGVLATAYGTIDVEYAKKKGIVVSNIPGYSTESVAEFVIAVILEHIKELEKGKKRGREGDYSSAEYSVIEIKNKIFGILGLGKIGSRVAEIALGFGADVRYWSRNRKPEMEAKGIKYEDADSLIPKCDFLSLNFAQAKETENFLDEERIKKIKKGAVVISTAPMELVDMSSLARRLEKNDMTFILDHSDEMSADYLEKLSKYKNCIIYPPIAYVSNEARIAKQEIFLDNIESFLKGSPKNIAT